MPWLALVIVAPWANAQVALVLLARVVQALPQCFEPSIVAVLTVMIIVLITLPLRDGVQRLLDRFFRRGQAEYGQLLQDYAQELTAPDSLPGLVTKVADQVDDVFHPVGLALVQKSDADGYRVVLSRGELSSQPLWKEDTVVPSQHPIPARLMASNRPLYLGRRIHDLSTDQRREWQQALDDGVHVLIPMKLGERLCGWLALGPKEADLSYTRQDISFLNALVAPTCVALENARLYGEMQQRATEMALVAMVSSAISSSLELELVLETIVESVIRVVGADKSAIFEVSKGGNELSLRMARGLSQSFVDSSRDLLVQDDNRALALATGAPLIVSDVRSDPRLPRLSELAEQEGFCGIVDVPLVVGENTLGVLSVYFERVHSPSESEMEMLSTFASQAAIAIENARLYEAVTRERDRATQMYKQTDAALARRVEELTAIEEISRQLTSTLDMQQVMALLLERALQATRADRGFIALCDPDGKNLQVLSSRGYPPALYEYQAQPWSMDKGITGRAARGGCSELTPDVDLDPDYVRVDPGSLTQLSVPMSHEGSVLGVITLESDHEAAFAAEQVRFIELLAEHAVIAVSNSRLFQQVIETRDQLEVILNSTHDLVLVMNTEGEIILTNRRVRELLGDKAAGWLRSLSLVDAIRILDGKASPFLEVDVQDLVGVVKRIQEHPDQEVDIAFSYQDRGQQRYVEGVASPMSNAAGETMGWVTVMREVTQRKELERFREDLTSMVIHNLQGPLAALISSLETMKGNGPLEADMAGQLLEIALMSGHKLYHRIESLLWIRRLEERRMPLNLERVPLRAIIEPVVDEYLPLARSAGICLETVIPEAMPYVLIDEELIGRVFSNLVDNALKYVHEGGWVQVRTSVQHDDNGPYVLCSVADNGTGISDSAKDVLFGKFRRGEPSVRGTRRGMGIGLHYCKASVEAHQGTIWVESQKGQGSVFQFTLPIAGEDVL